MQIKPNSLLGVINLLLKVCDLHFEFGVKIVPHEL